MFDEWSTALSAHGRPGVPLRLSSHEDFALELRNRSEERRATVRDKFVYQFISIQERKAFSARGIPPSSE